MLTELTEKLQTIIKKHGIKEYINSWDPPDVPDSAVSRKEARQLLNNYVKSYHFHSFVMDEKEKGPMSKYTGNKMPKFFWDDKRKIGRICFYSFAGSNSDEIYKLVNTVQSHIQNWLELGIKGIIIDLSKFQGGNMWPPISSLIPLLKNSTLLSFGHKRTFKNNPKGWINLDKDGHRVIGRHIPIKPLRVPTAVIIGPNTASSGEFIALVFAGRSKTFGQRTAGFLSVNSNFDLGHNFAAAITVELPTDATGKFHTDEYLEPDVKTTKPVSDAKKWIIKNNP